MPLTCRRGHMKMKTENFTVPTASVQGHYADVGNVPTGHGADRAMCRPGNVPTRQCADRAQCRPGTMPTRHNADHTLKKINGATCVVQ